MQQLPKLSSSALAELKTHKNLLAFSAGSDSSALFFMLKEFGIDFDIALVNYKTRAQSDEEQLYAQELAKTYNKECYVFTCKLEQNNFEHNAREQRYNFFKKVMSEHNYTNLLTAHHLNDKLEWFLMQLSKGAGCVELSGMSEIEKHEEYTTIRPLLHVKKNAILEFLHVNQIKHFLDSSNNEKKYFRNQIRANFANDFCEKYADGIQKSFTYLQNDSQRLLPKNIQQIKQLYILPRDEDDLINIRGIDKIVKKLGVLLSHKSRNEIIKTKNCIVSAKIAIAFNEEKIFICPFMKTTMDKKFKEACRIAKIPSKIRAYMYKENITI